MEREFDEVVLRENERKLFISRLPKNIKEEFTKFAEEEFCDDFGMAFKNVWDCFKLWNQVMYNVDLKLN